jgi:hypothetical protein
MNFCSPIQAALQHLFLLYGDIAVSVFCWEIKQGRKRYPGVLESKNIGFTIHAIWQGTGQNELLLAFVDSYYLRPQKLVWEPLSMDNG